MVAQQLFYDKEMAPLNTVSFQTTFSLLEINTNINQFNPKYQEERSLPLIELEVGVRYASGTSGTHMHKEPHLRFMWSELKPSLCAWYTDGPVLALYVDWLPFCRYAA